MTENVDHSTVQAFEEQATMTETSETSRTNVEDPPPASVGVRGRATLPSTTVDFKAVREVTLKIRPHEIAAFIGPSGCGKSTVLRCFNRMNDTIAGARVEGSIKYHGVDLYGPDVSATQVRRHIGMVFQKPNPFPKSIYDNVAYGPRIAGARKKSELDGIVEESLRGAALWDEVKDRLKSSGLGLSGGQQQRLCIATSPGRAARSDPDGRAVLGTRSDRHCPHRGSHARDQVSIHHRHRHSQHAAGRPHQRPGGLLHDRGLDRGRPSHRGARRVREDIQDVLQPL